MDYFQKEIEKYWPNYWMQFEGFWVDQTSNTICILVLLIEVSPGEVTRRWGWFVIRHINMWIRLRLNWKMRDAQSILWSTNFLEGLFKFIAGGRLHRDLFNVFLTKLAFKMQRMFTVGQVNHPPTWSVLFGATVLQSNFRLDPVVKWCLLNRPSVWNRSVNQICLLFPLSRSGFFWTQPWLTGDA